MPKVKPVVKKSKKVSKKPVAAKAVKKVKKSKPAAAGVKPIKAVMTKSQLVDYYVDRLAVLDPETGWARSDVKRFLDLQEETINACMAGAGEFMMHGMLKITTRRIPARKAGVMVRNPGTGEMMKGKFKPASVRVKARPLTKLKAAVL